uniref:Ubiquinol-cytochrome c chaperone domain-containing protein n=1 Tax=Oncorhynchus tshawytscha TaxID=74940 RepID=A0AAZ3QER4_ONCTS
YLSQEGKCVCALNVENVRKKMINSSSGKIVLKEGPQSPGKELACRGSVLGLADGTVHREPVSLVHSGPGILSGDGVLAAALWRNMFKRQCEDPRQLELMLEYVRKQMQFIDTLDGEDLLLTGEVKWRPLLEENAQSILKVPSSTYNDAGL